MDQELSFFDHLEELRWRLIRVVISICIGFCICFYFSEGIFDLLMQPILEVLPSDSRALHFTGLIEPFMINIKVGFIAGFFLVCPYIFYQLWAFIAPGLYQQEKRYVVPFVFSTSLFFLFGAFFGYFIVFPAGFKFFLEFASETIKPILTIDEYFSLTTKLMFVFGFVFETPVFIFAISMMGIIHPASLFKAWRHVTVGICILSAMLTPADVLTMIMMATPLLILYFGTACFVYLLFGRQKVPAQ